MKKFILQQIPADICKNNRFAIVQMWRDLQEIFSMSGMVPVYHNGKFLICTGKRAPLFRYRAYQAATNN